MYIVSRSVEEACVAASLKLTTFQIILQGYYGKDYDVSIHELSNAASNILIALFNHSNYGLPLVALIILIDKCPSKEGLAMRDHIVKNSCKILWWDHPRKYNHKNPEFVISAKKSYVTRKFVCKYGIIYSIAQKFNSGKL